MKPIHALAWFGCGLCLGMSICIAIDGGRGEATLLFLIALNAAFCGVPIRGNDSGT